MVNITENIIEYIKAGVLFSKTSNQFVTLAIGPLLLALTIGVGPGIILGNEFLIIFLMMLITSVAFLISVFFCSRGNLDIQKRLFLQSLVYLSFVLQFQLLIIMFYIMSEGPVLMILFICLSITLLPIFIGLRNTKLIQSSTYSNKIQKNGSVTFAWTGVIGILIGKIFFDNMKQDLAILVTILIFFVINSFLSIGLLSIHRLYYFYKLKREGIFVE